MGSTLFFLLVISLLGAFSTIRGGRWGAFRLGWSRFDVGRPGISDGHNGSPLHKDLSELQPERAGSRCMRIKIFEEPRVRLNTNLVLD